MVASHVSHRCASHSPQQSSNIRAIYHLCDAPVLLRTKNAVVNPYIVGFAPGLMHAGDDPDHHPNRYGCTTDQEEVGRGAGDRRGDHEDEEQEEQRAEGGSSTAAGDQPAAPADQQAFACDVGPIPEVQRP